MFYEQYLANIKPEDDIKLYSFRLGYFFHLICDIMWAKRIGAATKRDFKELFDKIQRKPSGLSKMIGMDWINFMCAIIPKAFFWRVIMPNPNPPSYLPFIKNEALHHQYDHIRKYYSQQEDQWFLSLPYHYLNEKTMSRIVDESMEAVLIVHEKLQI